MITLGFRWIFIGIPLRTTGTTWGAYMRSHAEVIVCECSLEAIRSMDSHGFPLLPWEFSR